jgi:hypothetical protein
MEKGGHGMARIIGPRSDPPPPATPRPFAILVEVVVRPLPGHVFVCLSYPRD